MKKIFIAFGVLIFCSIGIYAFQSKEPLPIKSEALSSSFLEKNIPIIDIRTSTKQRETGFVKGSFNIRFFNIDGSVNETLFFQKLRQVVRKGDTFAILYDEDEKSAFATRYLVSKGFPNVINLAGGIKKAQINGVRLQHN